MFLVLYPTRADQNRKVYQIFTKEDVYDATNHVSLIIFQVRINRSVLAVAFSRVVLMHMIATNMCLWFHTIITESLREIDELGQDEDIPHLHSHPPQTTSSSIETNETMTGKEEHAVFMALSECILMNGRGGWRWGRLCDKGDQVGKWTYINSCLVYVMELQNSRI